MVGYMKSAYAHAAPVTCVLCGIVAYHPHSAVLWLAAGATLIVPGGRRMLHFFFSRRALKALSAWRTAWLLRLKNGRTPSVTALRWRDMADIAAPWRRGDCVKYQSPVAPKAAAQW